MDVANLAFLFLLLCMGWALHIFKKWGEAWQAGNELSLRDYFGKNPPATAMSIGAPLVLWVLMAYTGELSEAPPIMAGWGSASLGWLGNSAADIFGSRAAAFKAKATNG